MCTKLNYGFFIDKHSNSAAAGSLNCLLAELLLNTWPFSLKEVHIPFLIFEALSMAKHYYSTCSKSNDILEKYFFLFK